MNIKPAEQLLNFEGAYTENSKSTPFQSYRSEKSRVSYGGGFHINKKPDTTPPPQLPEASKPHEIASRVFSPDMHSSIQVLENEIQRLKFQSQGIEKFRNSKYTEGILHLDPPSHSHRQVIEEQSFNRGNISLEELAVLKERNASRLLQIEAELSRSKFESQAPKDHFRSEYVPLVTKEKKTLKSKSIQDYEKKYQGKFQKYIEEKEKNRRLGLIKGKELKITENTLEENEDTLENEVLLKWMFKKLDKDKSGTVDKLELIQEFHQNPELANIFGFKEAIDSPRYLERFNQIFEKIGLGLKHEITMPEFLQFFESFSKSSKKIEQKIQKPQPVSKSPKKILKKSSSSTKILNSSKEATPICLLSNKHMKKLEEIFESLDAHQDLVVQRGYLVQTIMDDPNIIKILHIDAVRISHFQVLDLESMLIYIQNDGDGEEELINSLNIFL